MNYLPTNFNLSSNLVDLCSGYKVFLEQIDSTNEVRRYQGETLITYPTFEEYVAECSAAAFDPEHKFSARIDELVSISHVLEAGAPDDDLDLDKLLPLPAFGFMPEDEEDVRIADTDFWDTEFGSFAINNATRH
ncbi:hypothetical protein GOD90_16940 [Sinorhizobium medicae]|uniref:Uncharacterized protein n=1 Tax=Sinorhizobium medicae (strain WSM419) TaxID=366394 RepID=A6U8R5_SINMW|nr:hypothetical protein [Sinorhizobium medicae]ABR60045.1 hypothetical protein Smed_1195 [Sinorhizobium medicae WSM419]MDX0480564.1 hypothetical protein [Sinorhizobium medicae]MDX0838038.1 hypothetical protein [Sinorhizobium medicae]MDX0851380.1 hypothetical protein [Sinorhizobium medicae]MDX0898659.1 hypothetical protein [Sinorhizobium medicae]